MKSVLITGGSKGLGKELVNAFLNEGYKVFCTYNSTPINNSDCVAIKCDLRSDEDINNLVEVIKSNGGVDVLVNNSALEYNTSMNEKNRDSFKETFDVNLFGPFLLTREIGKLMFEKKSGRIINISSNNSIDKYDMYTLEYDCSKASVNLLTKVLAKEFAPYVNVNAVLPGWILTDKIKELDNSLNNIFIKEEEKNNLLNRLATCDDVCKLVTFLASDKASYINGELIRIDGGNK